MALILLLFSSKTYSQENLCENNPARAWWDVIRYDLEIDFGNLDGYIQGKCLMQAVVISKAIDSMQIDLNMPMEITQVMLQNEKLDYARNGNYYMVYGNFPGKLGLNDTLRLDISFKGKPVIAKNPPWNGGFVLSKSTHQKWLGVTCQSEGGSLWFPCKNIQSDEAEFVSETYKVPASVKAIGNGRLEKETKEKGAKTFKWVTKNPINTYNITFYIGDYRHFSDTVQGLQGRLTMDFYILRENLQKAIRHFGAVRQMIACFEEKLGPYPFYEDGYKIVEAPYFGMEHQSAIAYGNKYKKGYEGEDISGTGVGLLFDYIIVHESGHEWFGNSITAADKADNWIHEGFTSYTETIFAECLFGKDKAFQYQTGKRKLIRNTNPVQGKYLTCGDENTDIYNKGAQIVHMIRMLIKNDSSFWNLMRVLNRDFYHKIVYSADIENSISKQTGIDLSKFFDQYLRHTEIPVLEVRNDEEGMLECRYSHCIEGFDMPLDILIKDQPKRVFANTKWSSTGMKVNIRLISKSMDFLVSVKFPEEGK